MKKSVGNLLHLRSLNHISLVCRSVEESINLYQNVLGLVPIRRPGSFNFGGSWLFGYGIGIHLLQSENSENMPKKKEINLKDNHISFQAGKAPVNASKVTPDVEPQVQPTESKLHKEGIQDTEIIDPNLKEFTRSVNVREDHRLPSDSIKDEGVHYEQLADQNSTIPLQP